METIANKYIITDKKLGEGGFSKVFLGKCLATNENVAIKKVALIQKNFDQRQIIDKLHFETELMQKLDHPNIVKYYDVIKTSTYWYIVMEYCYAGTLDDVVNFNESMTRKKSINFNREANTYYYLNQLKDALDYVRRLGYVHRDIKPMNILLTKHLEETDITQQFTDDASTKQNNFDHTENLIVKLADFGLAKLYAEHEESLMNTICGSPLYMAPELLLDREYNSKADLWSYGIIMYQMLFGVNPNDTTSFPQLVNYLKTKEINFHLYKNFTSYCFDLLTKLLIKDPQKRINWGDVFNHKWFIYWTKMNQSDKSLIVDSKYLNDLELKSSLARLARQEINVNPKIGDFSEPMIPVPGSSPLGSSNLSKMKIAQFYPRNFTQGTYADYPSSYPPLDSKKTSVSLKSSFLQSNISPEHVSKPIEIAANQRKNLFNSSILGVSSSCGNDQSSNPRLLIKNDSFLDLSFSNMFHKNSSKNDDSALTEKQPIRGPTKPEGFTLSASQQVEPENRIATHKALPNDQEKSRSRIFKNFNSVSKNDLLSSHNKNKMGTSLSFSNMNEMDTSLSSSQGIFLENSLENSTSNTLEPIVIEMYDPSQSNPMPKLNPMPKSNPVPIKKQ